MNQLLVLEGEGGGGSVIYSLLLIVIMLVLMYFMTVRPARKQQQQYDDMMDALKVGDEVVLRSGLHGIIDDINEEDRTVTLDCDGIYLVFERSAVSKIVNNEEDSDEGTENEGSEVDETATLEDSSSEETTSSDQSDSESQSDEEGQEDDR